MESKTLYSGDLLAGRYLIVNSLGKGGVGHTYIAKDKQFPGNPKCVVKQFKPHSDNPEVLKDLQRLFSQESEMLSELGRHNQIPNLLAHFSENDQFYLVQEWIDRQELSFEVCPGNRFAEHYVISVLYEILEVLEVVHQKGVIHRDIKPANIMRRKTDGKLVLIDFGAVKEVGQLSTVVGQSQPHTICIGTPGFMPNEQRAGTPKLSSDIYAVGMLGIQALTGITPSELPTDPESGEVIWHEQISISAALRNILDTMVRYDFRQRYPNATKAKEALHPLRLNLSEPIVTTPSNSPNEFMAKPFQEPISSEQPSTVLNPNHPSPPSKPPKKRQGIPFRAFGWGLLLGLIGGVAGTLYIQYRFMPHIFSDSYSKSSELPGSSTESGAPSPSPSSEVSPVASPSPASAVPSSSSSPAVKSAAIADYTQLKTALAAGQWKVADQLTRDLVLSLTGRSGSILRVEDVEQIPCSDVKTLDQLWEQSSQGRFGFKAQQKVWQTVVGKSPETINVDSGNTNEKILTAYVTKTGWLDSRYNSWVYYGNLTFALNAPVGHLPAKVLVPADSPTDQTTMRDSAALIPSLAQRVTFCESKR